MPTGAVPAKGGHTHEAPETGAPSVGEGSPSCRLARGKLQGVKVNDHFNFISLPGPKLINLSWTVGISLSKDSQSNALSLPPFCSACLLFSHILQVYHWEFSCKSSSLLTTNFFSTTFVGESLFLLSPYFKKSRFLLL